jgi:hypothetical protein
MKEQNVESEESKKDQKPGQQTSKQPAGSEQQHIIADSEKANHLRAGENKNARSDNNDTLGVP